MLVAILHSIHRRPQPEVVGLTTEDEGPSTICLQGIPHESGKGNKPEAESDSSG